MNMFPISRQVVQLQADHAKVQAPPFRVLQWNVLGDGLAQGGEFVKVNGAVRAVNLGAPRLACMYSA
jgi:hypothetical protein